MAFPSPSLVVPTLANYQFNYNNALTFGAGTAWGFLKAQGFDLASIANKDVQRPRDFGMIVGLDVYSDRTITFDMWMKSDGVSLQDAQLQLAAAFPIEPDSDTYPLWFQLPNLPTQCIMCRVRKRSIDIDSDYSAGGVAKPKLVLHATDPRIYGQGQSSTLALGGTIATGLGPFPVGPFPVTFGVGSQVTTIVVNNTGNCEMRPLVIFNGPLTNPFITNSTQSATLTVSNPLQVSYTVLAGDQLSIDLDLHTITYYPGGMSSGAASYTVANYLTSTSTWWDIAAGNNTIQFGSADSVNTGGTCVFEWAPAWQL
jgi:hypothetical protein